MCVNSKNLPWERPASMSDIPTLCERFPGVQFESLLEHMSRDGARPLTTDLTLVGAMIHTEPDELGMRYVPFLGIKESGRTVCKLPVMDQIVDWFENSALGTDMWKHASEWAKTRHGGEFHFAMNCGCGLVASSARDNGNWSRWQQNFNAKRSNLYGRTIVTRRDSNSIKGLDITQKQLDLWYRIRETLEALPIEDSESNRINIIEEKYTSFLSA